MQRGKAAVERDRIFDVGAFAGDDSAYYLRKGYRVAAVEPNPRSVSRLQERFAAEIASGRLTVLPVAISDSEGEAQFWVCDDVAGWSSFDRAIASYRHARHHDIQVPTCSFSSLLERFGTPYYCKIDIEGSDRLCLDQMTESTAPPYISIELPTIGSSSRAKETRLMMDCLQGLGYARFKVISQMTFRQPGRLLPMLQAHLPSPLSARVTLLNRATRRYRMHDGWRFGDDSSGPFAEDTRGGWLSVTDARQLIAVLQQDRNMFDWYDLHAALPEVE